MTAKRSGGYPTIKDISQHAGVSKSLVSRALRGEGHVRESTRQRIVESAVELGYRAHAGARSLAGTSSNTLGFVVTGLFDAFWGEVMFAVDAEAGRRGMRTLYLSSPPDAGGEREVIDRMLEYRVDGLALGLLGRRDAPELEEYADVVPTLALMYDLRSAHYDTLVTDDEAAMASAVSHLAELGHSSIALIGDADMPNVAARSRGYTVEMERRGLGAHICCEPAGFLQADGRQAAGRLLHRPRRPTAIACVNDAQARGAVLAATDCGWRVPDDLSVTGFDDSLYAVAGLPGLTTVRLPRADIGRTAVSMLSDRLNGRDTALVSVLHAELVVRDSSGPAR
ncbi:LacI family DNA-binding transcriptional regulator [Candidatus Poriferisodalis sp.]|uniref:LacI family DNA-binding transcriptional regulator n=1 Tax=Candidatus Poriferisodalis sp. TaxID=3101277 RepID=UPI003B02DE31